MEKRDGKRERIEDSNESGRMYEEQEASQAKRLCKETNVDVVCEFMIKMDNEELGFGGEEMEEEMVWDMMKMLEQEIFPSPSCSDSDDAGTSSNGCDESDSSGDKDCSSNAEIDYLLGASDDELGIPSTPSADDYDYDSCGFFESLQVEEAERQLLLQIWLDYGGSVEEEGSDIFSVHDLHILSNQIES